MTEQEFIELWRVKYSKSDSLYSTTPTSHASSGDYFRVKCPYCEKRNPELGPDKNHHCHVHFKEEYYRCMRCGARAPVLSSLLGLSDDYKALNQKKWDSYRVTEEEEQRARKKLLHFNRIKSKSKPGQLISLLDLPATHVAMQYLKSEGFSYKEVRRLCSEYGIFYCNQGKPFTDKPLNTTTHRLIFPIECDGESVGWQARWLPKTSWPPSPEEQKILKQKPSLLDKYITSPGMKKSYLPYNWEKAKNWDTIVVVEGIKKVWKTGPFSIGILGISSANQAPEGTLDAIAKKHWIERLKQARKPVWFLFDRNGVSNALEYAQTLSSFGIQARVCALPEGMPDDLDDYKQHQILKILLDRFGNLPKIIKKPTKP